MNYGVVAFVNSMRINSFLVRNEFVQQCSNCEMQPVKRNPACGCLAGNEAINMQPAATERPMTQLESTGALCTLP